MDTLLPIRIKYSPDHGINIYMCERVCVCVCVYIYLSNIFISDPITIQCDLVDVTNPNFNTVPFKITPVSVCVYIFKYDV